MTCLVQIFIYTTVNSKIKKKIKNSLPTYPETRIYWKQIYFYSRTGKKIIYDNRK